MRGSTAIRSIPIALLWVIVLSSYLGLATARKAVAGSGAVSEVSTELRGPNGGKLLRDGNVTVELKLVEQGNKAQFRAWIQQDERSIAEKSAVTLSVELQRLGGETERYRLVPADDYWHNETAVREPHSFDINVLLILNGERSEWNYASHEGRVKIADDMAEENGIATAIAGAGKIRRALTLYGRTALAHEDMRHVRARFPGPVTEVLAELGDQVRRGQKLAVVESNDSLQTYAVVSPIDGLVVEHEIGAGEFSGDRVLFTVANYDTLWAELQVFPQQQGEIRRGQRVTLSSDERRVGTTIFDILPSTSGQSFLLARASFDNREENWPPGLLIEGRVIVEDVQVPLVVENRALQPYLDGFAVFVKVGDIYEARPLELGRRDDQVTEIVDGLKAGERYVTANSFLIKADIEKSGTAHDH
ncbi:Cobalt-zinc-cadmium resistance protein CzcB [Microbulbifer aggregans]|uniref:Cobalt-zinc-cadmium resistance protein CzcB n=1 Tax=Microbulbifer aggregans TaxID=1769779 RepID=A0A1C9W573_9GAMM|nr:efflux RND transporter periplasmic adaptor subunit [Microbulbifer aggregans]AOS96289.1 Cobalt-zinc-cadmium resistance protein CzcB [Microbulbifer aggregans]